MKKLRQQLFNQIVFLALILVFTACYGQVKTNLSKTTTNSPPKMVRTQGVVSGNVECELQDKAGNLWFSTSGEGVYRYDGTSFENFTTKDGLISNDINGIIEDKAGNILLGTNRGICKYAPKQAAGKSFTNLTDNIDASKQPISSLFEDREGNLWFGTMQNGVYRYDGKTFTNFLNSDDARFNLGAKNQFIVHILQDKTGNIWFCSWNGGGVWRYHPKRAVGQSFKNYLPPADYYRRNEDGRSIGEKATVSFLPKPTYSPSQDSLPDDMIFSVTEDRAGNLWFATRRHGACRFDGKTFTSFGEKEGFVSYGIYSILEDQQGNLWFTTDKNGVWRYDPKQVAGKPFKNFTTKDGLINNSVFSILEDKDGNLWFGTRGFGLSRYNGKIFTNFSE